MLQQQTKFDFTDVQTRRIDFVQFLCFKARGSCLFTLFFDLNRLFASEQCVKELPYFKIENDSSLNSTEVMWLEYLASAYYDPFLHLLGDNLLWL